MSVMSHLRIALRNYGPFREGELEVKPLTIIIGTNSSGKSMLAYLLWSLYIAMPDFSVLADKLPGRVSEVAERILGRCKRGEGVSEDFRELLELHVEALLGALNS